MEVQPSESHFCRICHEGEEEGKLFSPCKCSGTMKFVHVECLTKWRNLSKNPQSTFFCENCKYKYNLYRPIMAKLLKSDAVISGVTISIVALLTVGSGSGVSYLSGRKWELKNALINGLVVIGACGIVPKLPSFVTDLLHTHWHKGTTFNERYYVPAFITLLALGVLSTCIEIYFKVRKTAKYLVKYVGQKVLEVNANDVITNDNNNSDSNVSAANNYQR